MWVRFQMNFDLIVSRRHNKWAGLPWEVSFVNRVVSEESRKPALKSPSFCSVSMCPGYEVIGFILT